MQKLKSKSLKHMRNTRRKMPREIGPHEEISDTARERCRQLTRERVRKHRGQLEANKTSTDRKKFSKPLSRMTDNEKREYNRIRQAEYRARLSSQKRVNVKEREKRYRKARCNSIGLLFVVSIDAAVLINGFIIRMAPLAITEISSNLCFGGYQKVFSHESSELKCKMNFAVYLPPQASTRKVPVLYWLSGLTCTEQNFISKAGAQRYASEQGVMIVAPDTSPRGCGIEGEDDSWDFGIGAGFYVNATQEKWKSNYRMYSYITKELQDVVNCHFSALPDKVSIFGHSMGGHGALICALKNPGKYRSVSAFAPICNPINCPWGQKAFTGYLGTNTEDWKAYDATELLQNYWGPDLHILIDQGETDQFLESKQLLPENLVAAASKKGTPVTYRKQPGYDHSYYFIATFVEDHIKHHVKYLTA